MCTACAIIGPGLMQNSMVFGGSALKPERLPRGGKVGSDLGRREAQVGKKCE